jgi:hypothetical protein
MPASLHPERPQDLAKIRNSIERRAHLVVDLLEDRAQRIVDSLDEPPPGTTRQDPQTVRDMWSFSPFGEQAPEVFWMLHDQALQMLNQDIAAQGLQGDQLLNAIRGARQKAEASALGRVYPHRAAIMLLGVTTPERSVALAKRAQRLVEQEDKRQGKPEVNPAMEAMAYG